MRRVAWPKQMGRTPLAMGSSVPPWPTFFWPVSRLTMRTMSIEVSPAGL